MIEVLFTESEAASMKIAKNTVIKIKTDGPTSVWMVGKKKTPRRENSGWIQGTSTEVICLPLMLDIGDIKMSIESPYRKDLIYSMYAQNQWEQDPETEAELYGFTDKYIEEIHRLEDYLEVGEAIRVWYSHAAYSTCGLYYLCSLLNRYKNEVRVVKLPEHEVKPGVTLSYQNWGEVAAEEFAGFLKYEKKLSVEEVKFYAMRWNELVQDNSPLRAVVNGKVVGVPENFYDFLILKRVQEEPVKEARLIGDILGRNQIGVGDWWYAKRIDFLIEQGKIKVVEDSKKKYGRMLQFL